jgi:von Willebrand factor type A domain
MVALVRRRPSIPLADAPALGGAVRRTSLLRLVLALALVVALGAAVWLARDLRTRPTSYFAAGGGGVLVLDLSTSVDPARYQRMSRVLRTIVETGQPTGVVAFSDSAYEMLPPGTHGEELEPFLRFFQPPDGRGRVTQGFGFLESPWSGSFRGGTRISTGLRVARQMIVRDEIAPATVVLVSDLDDSPFDLEPLTQEAIQYERLGIQLRVVPLFPGEDDRAFFENLAGPGAFVPNAELLRNTALEEHRSVVGAFPFWLFVTAAGVCALLALNEYACARLGWRAAPA